MKRFGLGRGLTALLPEALEPKAGVPQEIPLEALRPNPYQPRRRETEEGLEELADSIRRHGILQPILVRPVADGYQIVAGERRWRAAQRAGLTSIPALVRDWSDKETLLLALIENLQREDLNPIEAAEAYQRALQEFHWTQEELAAYLGKSRAAIANTLRLLSLPPEIRQSIAEGRISEGHGRALLAISDEKERRAIWQRILRESLTVRDVERLARSLPSSRPRARPASDPHLEALEDRLRRATGNEARIVPGRKGGALMLRYYSEEDLERLVALIERGARGGKP